MVTFILNCIIQAVEFVMDQHDDELWDELIRQCLQKPEMVIGMMCLTFLEAEASSLFLNSISFY
jgi:hypothetical protein